MPKKPPQSFTERTLASKELKKPGWYADASLPGFLFHRREDGSAQFVIRYQVRGTAIRRMKSLGPLGTVTLAEARSSAREILSAAARGGDPIGESKAAPTWADWSQRYFTRLEARSKEAFHRYLIGLAPELSKHGTPTDPTFREIRARWGGRRIDRISTEDIEVERQALRAKGDSTANRWLAVVSGAFSAAAKSGLIPRNPASAVTALREAQPRSRVLSPEETHRLLGVLATEGDRYAVAAVLLALLAGARRAEALGLRWENVNLTDGVAVLPDSKSGKRRYLAIVPYLVGFLRTLPRVEPFVVASESPKRPRPDIKKAWVRITAAAGIDGVTFHDLRRTYGLALNRAGGLRVAQEGLGHSSPDVTASTYTPENFDSVKAAAMKAAEALGLPN